MIYHFNWPDFEEDHLIEFLVKTGENLEKLQNQSVKVGVTKLWGSDIVDKIFNIMK